MNKALILFAIIALGACAGGLFGQETKKPYSYTFDGAYSVENGKSTQGKPLENILVLRGNCTFMAVSFDQVWAAIIKALTLDKFKIQFTMPKKDWGLIVAASDFHFSIRVEVKGQDISVVSSLSHGPGEKSEGIEADQKAHKKLFDKMAEILYTKADKK